MPSASDELCARWDDVQPALAQLGDRFIVDQGHIRPRVGTVVTADDESAIDYLFYEWDYCYHPCNQGAGGLPCGRDRCAWCGKDAP